MSSHYDVIIIGSGIVGLTLAALLQKNNFITAIVESKSPEKQSDTLTARVSAIHRHSQQLLTYLDVWKNIPEKLRALLNHMFIWDHAQNTIDFDNDGEPIAWIVNNHAISEALLEKYHGDYFCPDAPVHFSQNTLTLRSGKKLTADIIVGADGADSWVRRQMPITMKTRSYEQKSIIAVIETEQPHQHCAYQKFLTTGPVALLPLSHPHHTALVWSADDAVSDQLMRESDQVFSESLTKALDCRLGNLTSISPRSQFPLVMRHVKEYAYDRFVLAGDAAHTIHPLAGLGVNLGLMDVACLTQVLCDARLLKKPLYDQLALRKYTRWRKAENTGTLLAMRGLQTFFALDSKMFNAIRGLGLTVIDRCASIKECLMTCAMGSDCELPMYLKETQR